MIGLEGSVRMEDFSFHLLNFWDGKWVRSSAAANFLHLQPGEAAHVECWSTDSKEQSDDRRFCVMVCISGGPSIAWSNDKD